ncbi:hypothetical protein HJG60_011628 [Phyllostomus discolor]|uniref:Uncharacterized protein n=1 Tax=Phyllostomus discolor TaxID=89673 RepID=A0A834E0Z8_9CHIR|nr:hypothetical protein HJG60_011628 [Phyllostomus discolor]
MGRGCGSHVVSSPCVSTRKEKCCRERGRPKGCKFQRCHDSENTPRFNVSAKSIRRSIILQHFQHIRCVSRVIQKEYVSDWCTGKSLIRGETTWMMEDLLSLKTVLGVRPAEVPHRTRMHAKTCPRKARLCLTRTPW